MHRSPPLIPALLRLCLALAVAVVSAQTALGRAEARGASLIEICLGPEVSLITLDAKGDPVSGHPTCPDCVLSGLATATGTAQAIPPTLSVSPATQSAAGKAVAVALPPPAAARGPPGAPSRA